MFLNTYKITIKGTVQGVGFRPFIYILAERYILTGTVSNGSAGVEIFVNTDTITLTQFLTAIEFELPPLASIEMLQHEEVEYQEFLDFKIIETKNEGDVTVNIPADVSVCKACETELFDSTNRRYGYPFITCTHCGVRYSIIHDLPYDRINTSMKFFEMCKACEEEYTNPLDRRYPDLQVANLDHSPNIQLVERGIFYQEGYCILLHTHHTSQKTSLRY